ncbi:sugar ABC transporter permease [Clostridium sp. JN-1]|uniref:carbohydrate ABC transporter permease n=1 Tax=Clostridium sp. JN-1 TaxID=2483110 RepID=UPI000F0B7A9E|nr:sugar ABC transporter permease [Clostridium sp. JN-1]
MKRDDKQAFAFLLPTALIMIGLVFYPSIKTFFYSLQEYKLTDPENLHFIGFENYKEILKSQAFQQAVVNTLIVMVVVLVIGFLFSIVVALILNGKTKLNGFLTAVAIIPWALPPIVNGQVWKFIFYSDFGLMNKILYKLGMIHEPIKWLNTRYGTLIIVGVIVAWRVIPFCAVVFLANIQSIPKEIYEAAEVDGANSKQIFINIIMPLLMPSVAIVLTNLTMSAINVFDEIAALVGFRTTGEPLLIYNYTQTFSFLNFGFGSAITYIIMISSGAFGYFYIRSINRGGEL